ncbi:MAG: 5'/3'-nucleotidase SurE [Acidimicrobiia bacterium]|nr:5'/3'-nucleotidase SurE [Acidimicrobiia bacterium]
MRVVVTNDDGVASPGLHALARCLVDDGHEVTVVAPSSDYSGYSAALGPLHVTGQIAFAPVRVAELPAMELIAVEGPPALCVLAACLGGFGASPELVVSGINAGANTGRAVLHSGTVGAAFTANSFGVPGIAVSQAAGETHHWETAAVVAAGLVEWITAQRDVFTLNVNVPNVHQRAIAAHAAMLDAGGEVQTGVIEAGEGVLQLKFASSPPRPGTDTAILAAGCIAITPLHAVRPAEVAVDHALVDIENALRSSSEHERVA